MTQDVKGEPSKRCGAGSGAGQVARARSPGGTLPPSGAKLGPLPPPTAALPAAAPCPRSWLKLKTQFGENVLIVGSETSDFGAIRSGDNVAIKGVWLSRGAGGVRAVSGHTRADSSYCFVGTGLEKVTTKARNLARPAVACERRGGGGERGLGALPGVPRRTLQLPPCRAAGGWTLQQHALAALSLPCRRALTPFCPFLCRPTDGPPPGVPANPTPAALAAAAALVPKDAGGLEIRSAAAERVGPLGHALPASAAVVATPRSKYVSNPPVATTINTLIIPSEHGLCMRARVSVCVCMRVCVCGGWRACRRPPRPPSTRPPRPPHPRCWPTLPALCRARAAVEAFGSDGKVCPGTAPTKCGGTSPCDVAKLKEKIFAELNKDGDSVGGSFNKCSLGAHKFDSTTSFVTDVIRVPCSGNTCARWCWAAGERGGAAGAGGRVPLRHRGQRCRHAPTHHLPCLVVFAAAATVCPGPGPSATSTISTAGPTPWTRCWWRRQRQTQSTTAASTRTGARVGTPCCPAPQAETWGKVPGTASVCVCVFACGLLAAWVGAWVRGLLRLAVSGRALGSRRLRARRSGHPPCAGPRLPACRVYLLPPSPCFWVGLGYVGCDGSYECRAWIGGDFWTTPQVGCRRWEWARCSRVPARCCCCAHPASTRAPRLQAIVHEMGHNLFQAHAGQFTDKGVFDECAPGAAVGVVGRGGAGRGGAGRGRLPRRRQPVPVGGARAALPPPTHPPHPTPLPSSHRYFDATDPMGFCCGNRCPNVAHGWQMGFFPVQQFEAEHLPPGTTVSVKLAPSSTVARAPNVAGIRINATWIKNFTEPIFVGYRVKVPSTPDVLVRRRRGREGGRERRPRRPGTPRRSAHLCCSTTAPKRPAAGPQLAQPRAHLHLQDPKPV